MESTNISMISNVIINNEADSNDGSDLTKIFAMIILGCGSFFSGILPMAISQQNRRRFPLVISVMLCFGAGVLLATALIHMLPDVQKNMTENAEIYFSGGFFIIYFIDEIVHFFFGEAIQHSHGTQSSSSPIANSNSNNVTQSNHNHNQNYDENSRNNNQRRISQHNYYGADSETSALLGDRHVSAHGHSHCDTETPNARICHVSHTEPCSNSMTGTLGLLCALSLHSFIEGLAIGVQNTKARVLVLLVAVACHKYVMGFCLGLELCSTSGSTIKSQIIAISVFSLGSVIGIGAGMAFVDLPMSLTQSALPMLQALAGGTLLYVTVCEVMPREKARWHQNRTRKYAGIIQFLAVSIGFVVMAVINFYLDDD